MRGRTGKVGGGMGILILVAALVPQGVAGAESICVLPEEDRPGPVEPVELCGTTTIVGSRSATMRVMLPTTARVLEPAVTISRPGRYGGVVFVEESPDHTGSVLLVSSLPRDALCDEDECPLPPVHVFSFVDDDWVRAEEGGDVLPAGTYVLHLIADGVPTEVTLGLEGRPGEVELAPESPADIEIQALEPRVPLEPSQSVFWGGGFRVRERTGMYIAASWAVFDPNFVYDHWACEYDFEPPEPIAYAPGCPGASTYRGTGGWVGIHEGSTLSRAAGIILGPPERGPLGLGQWLTLGGRAKKIGALNVWLTFS